MLRKKHNLYFKHRNINTQTETYKDKGSYPNAEYCSSEALAIPVHQYLTDREVSSIIKAIKEAI